MADKSLNEIRNTFLKYFEKNDHKIVESSNLVPNNDPTLMFANSGMVQFKNVFTGLEKRDYQRATTSQKCVRAGGKHNDLENVGYTPRHHTFFEMLGNFSFGDYFKEQAIHYAWNLITKDFGIDKNRLYVTVFHEDDEAFNFWKKIAGFSDDRIIRIATSDNFWSMGDTGPCGPCSEIFYDHGDHLAGGLPGTKYEDGNRFIEIWNLVFMQYEQVSKDERIDLPKPSVDTGMGLERIAALLQGTHDNYETDHFKKIISSTSEIIKTKQDQSNRSSFRVIADHLRASAFLIAEGVLPSNEGRGYVLRRIMRRGMRHSHLLGSKEPVFYNLFETLRDEMSGNYPELVRADSLIRETLKMVISSFSKRFSQKAGKAEDLLRNIVTGGTLFSELGFYYVGPIDGHDVENLVQIFENVKNSNHQGPVLIHVRTQKGKGYKPAEDSGDKYHGVSKLNVSTGEQAKSKSNIPSYTKVFAETLIKHAEQDTKIIGITGAMPSGTGLNLFEKKFPDRTFDVGIAEQHAVTFAAG